MMSCYQMCKQTNDPVQWARSLECCVRFVTSFSVHLVNRQISGHISILKADWNLKWKFTLKIKCTCLTAINRSFVKNETLVYPRKYLKHIPEFRILTLFFPCCRLLHIRNANCRYNEAEETWRGACAWIEKLENEAGHPVNKAVLYSEVCSLLFAKSLYDEVRTDTWRSFVKDPFPEPFGWTIHCP